MTATPAKATGVERLVEAIEGTSRSALDATRKFVDTVNDVIPDLGTEKPRRQIIDAAFKMTDHLVDTSSRMAKNVLDITDDAIKETAKKAPAAKRVKAKA